MNTELVDLQIDICGALDPFIVSLPREVATPGNTSKVSADRPTKATSTAHETAIPVLYQVI